jgi:serine phosphatase RsbU (regulator of sigma subunit)
VPLFDKEKVLGLIYVDSQDLRVAFNQEQLEVLTLLANMAAVKITNARLLEAEQVRARMAQELATAARIQRALLPPTAPTIPGYQFDAFLETCYEVGGDLYDFHVRDDGSVVFVVGDVSGKGMGASLLMSAFLASARVLYEVSRDPGELARRLGSIMFRTAEDGKFVTGFIGSLDPATGKLDYVNAGHPPPCLVRDGVLRELDSNAVPFGIMPNFPFQTESTVIEVGETLAVFSDGIPEAQHGLEFFDDKRVHETLLASPGDMVQLREKMIHCVREFVGDEPRSDDITLLLMRRES